MWEWIAKQTEKVSGKLSLLGTPIKTFNAIVTERLIKSGLVKSTSTTTLAIVNGAITTVTMLASAGVTYIMYRGVKSLLPAAQTPKLLVSKDHDKKLDEEEAKIIALQEKAARLDETEKQLKSEQQKHKDAEKAKSELKEEVQLLKQERENAKNNKATDVLALTKETTAKLALEKKLGEKEQVITQQTKTVSQQKAHIVDLQTHLKAEVQETGNKDKTIATQKETISNQAQTVSQQKAHIVDLQTHLKAEVQEVGHKDKTIATQKETISNQAQTVSQQKAHIIDLQRHLKEQVQENKKLSDENTELKDKLKKYTNFNQSLEQLEKDFKGLKEKHTNEIKELKRFHAEKVTLLTNQIKNMTLENNELRESNAKLRADLTNAEKKQMATALENAKNITDIKAKEARITTLMQRLSGLRNKHEEEIKQVHAQFEKKISSMSSSSDLEATLREIDALKKLIDEQAVTSMKEINSLEAELAKEKEAHQDTILAMTKLEEEIVKLDNEATDLDQEVTELDNEVKKSEGALKKEAAVVTGLVTHSIYSEKAKKAAITKAETEAQKPILFLSRKNY